MLGPQVCLRSGRCRTPGGGPLPCLWENNSIRGLMGQAGGLPVAHGGFGFQQILLWCSSALWSSPRYTTKAAPVIHEPVDMTEVVPIHRRGCLHPEQSQQVTGHLGRDVNFPRRIAPVVEFPSPIGKRQRFPKLAKDEPSSRCPSAARAAPGPKLSRSSPRSAAAHHVSTRLGIRCIFRQLAQKATS